MAESKRPSSGYEVRSVTVAEFQAWDDLVRVSCEGTLFHSTLWLEATGRPFSIVGCFRGAELRGGFSMTLAAQRVGVRPRFTPYMGPVMAPVEGGYATSLSRNREILAALAGYLIEHFDSVSVRVSPDMVDLQPFMWAGFRADLWYTYRLRLDDSPKMFANMASTRRRNIRAAERQGIRVHAGVPFAEIAELRRKTFDRQGRPSEVTESLCALAGALERAGRARGFVARNSRGTALSGVWIAWDETRAYYLIGGYDAAGDSADAGSLAMWEAIQFAGGEMRLREFDFAGSMVPAIERYFRKFGGTLTPTHTITYQRRLGLAQRISRKFYTLVKGLP